MNSHGESKLGCLILLIIVAGIIYVGFQWGEAQWNQETMKDNIERYCQFVASQKNADMGKVKEALIKGAEEAGIDLYEEDIDIKINELNATISVYWEAQIKLPGYIYYLEYTVKKRKRKSY